MNAEKLVAKVTNLPRPSPVVARLIALLNRPDADNTQVLQAIKCDSVLCARLLGACNSAAGGLATSIASVDQAIFILGYKRIYQMVLSLSVGDKLSRELPAYVIGPKELWKHSLLTGLIAEAIVLETTPIGIDPSAAYTAGLMHDIGKLVLAEHLPEDSVSEIRTLIEYGSRSRIDAERDVIGTDHAEVGACLLRSWQLPELIIEAVANHHAPAFAPVPMTSAVIHIADALAHDLGSAPGWNSYAVPVDENAAAALGIDGPILESLLATLVGNGSLERVEEVASMS